MVKRKSKYPKKSVSKDDNSPGIVFKLRHGSKDNKIIKAVGSFSLQRFNNYLEFSKNNNNFKKIYFQKLKNQHSSEESIHNSERGINNNKIINFKKKVGRPRKKESK
ncbi:hypothetical protein HDU92_005525 [Lobulomyces angularis]|nr:hypothetical protein HDU92_005525 [Lobulomyces angularis]